MEMLPWVRHKYHVHTMPFNGRDLSISYYFQSKVLDMKNSVMQNNIYGMTSQMSNHQNIKRTWLNRSSKLEEN